jgi:hypothetical protein
MLLDALTVQPVGSEMPTSRTRLSGGTVDDAVDAGSGIERVSNRWLLLASTIAGASDVVAALTTIFST